MDKKARAKPMTRMLERLAAYAEFDICIFGNECIVEQPIEAWPIVDALIAFFSDGFPLEKVLFVKVLISVPCTAFLPNSDRNLWNFL